MPTTRARCSSLRPDPSPISCGARATRDEPGKACACRETHGVEPRRMSHDGGRCAPSDSPLGPRTEGDPINKSDRLAHLTKEAWRAFTRAMQAQLAEHGVPFGHWTFLRILWERDGLTCLFDAEGTRARGQARSAGREGERCRRARRPCRGHRSRARHSSRRRRKPQSAFTPDARTRSAHGWLGTRLAAACSRGVEPGASAPGEVTRVCVLGRIAPAGREPVVGAARA